MATNIGTGPQDIPLNQFLGQLAFEDQHATTHFRVLASDPATGVAGECYFNTTDSVLRIYNGTEWTNISGSTPSQSFATVNASISNWTFLPDVDYYTPTAQTSNSNWNGSRVRITNGTGRVEFNNYEYPAYGKFAMRSSADDTLFFQLYNFAGNASGISGFNNSVNDGNMFQMGLSFNTIPTSSLTNSLEATSAIASGGCNWFCTDGTGTRLMGFYDGGANSNSQSQGSTNRESQSSVTWNDAPLTLVLTGDNHPTNPRRTVLFVGNTQVYKWNNQQASGMTNIYAYLGSGYPNGLDAKYTAALPEFRYGTTSANIEIT